VAAAEGTVLFTTALQSETKQHVNLLYIWTAKREILKCNLMTALFSSFSQHVESTRFSLLVHQLWNAWFHKISDPWPPLARC